MNNFWEKQIEAGYYDILLSDGIESGKGIQANWHNITLLNTQKFLQNGVLHLDYACGPGTLIGKFSNAESIGVDIAEVQIDYAKNKYSNKGLFLTNKNFSFDNYRNYFDVITILGLIEFLSDEEIESLLKEVYQSLKSDGKLIITTPNFNSLIYPLAEKLQIVNWGGEHKNKFNKKKVRLLLKNSLFKKYKIKKIINFGIFLSFISLRLGINFEKFFEKLFFNSQGFVIFIELEK